jgi:hypothetical protein
MNILDGIYNNKFLKSVFPAGLTESVFIAHIGFDPDSEFSLNIHTRQKPSREIPTWGVWGIDYDTVVIVMLGTGIDDIEIADWNKIDYGNVECELRNRKLHIQTKGKDWKIAFTFKTLTFQQSRTYLS